MIALRPLHSLPSQHTFLALRFRAPIIVALVLAPVLMALPHAPRAGAASIDWPQFGGNAQHSGTNTQEAVLSPATVGGLQRLFSVPLGDPAAPSVADGAPAFLSAVATADGVRDLLFLTTTDGYILALDAHTGAQIWGHQNGPSGSLITTSSPAIDPNRQFVYSYGLDGKVHKYQVGDGTESTSGGWPETATLKPTVEKGSSALTVATARNGVRYLYVTNSAYNGDQGDYQGHVTTINLGDGTQHVFNVLCGDQSIHFVEAPGAPDCDQRQGGVWARAGVVYNAATDMIYLTVGNGLYDPSSHDWGDSVLALHPDGTGVNGGPLDSYTPTNYSQLDYSDADLGSTAPAIVPAPAGSTVAHLGVQSGKDAMLRLLNLDNLSGQGGPGHTGGEIGPLVPVPQGNEVLTAPAVWVNPADQSTWVFVASYNGLSGLRVTVSGTGTPGLQAVWQLGGGSVTSPVVANGVLYAAKSGNLRALNPLTGAQLWSSTQSTAGESIGNLHWESPIVVNGILYCTDHNGYLSAYQLASTEPPSTSTSTPVSPTSTTTPASPPSATSTSTPVPPTSTPVPSSTNTPVPSTSTSTSTPAPPSSSTSIPVPPPSTSTNTPVPSTSTSADTPVPLPSTPVPPTSTSVPSTSTSTPVPATSTSTTTLVPPPSTSTSTSTSTPVPPPSTSTPVVPSATAPPRASATRMPTVLPRGLAIVVVSNAPHTVQGGRSTACDLRKNLRALAPGCAIIASISAPRAVVIYIIVYPGTKGVRQTAQDTADGRGHSLHVFNVPYRPPQGVRHGAPATIARVTVMARRPDGTRVKPGGTRFVVVR